MKATITRQSHSLLSTATTVMLSCAKAVCIKFAAFLIAAILTLVPLKALATSSGSTIDMSDSAPPASGTGWSYSNPGNYIGVYTINGNTPINIIGDNGGGSRRVVVDGVTVDITLDNAKIDVSGLSVSGLTAFELKNGATVNLTLIGTNILKSFNDNAGLQVTYGNTLVITAASDSHSLKASANGAASYAAGIGGGQGADGHCGDITINGGNITAEGGSMQRGGAGIGGGGNNGSIPGGNSGNITITGGTVTATGGGCSAGIGSASGSLNGGEVGTITITGGTVVATGGSYNLSSLNLGGAGIGGGAYNCNGGNIIISGGAITATGGLNAAGIGGGCGGHQSYCSNNNGVCGDIEISGGTVIATGNGGGRDIGHGGNYSDGSIINTLGGSITITGGSVRPTREPVATYIYPQPTNGNGSVYMNTLTLGSATSAPNTPVTAGIIDGVSCAATANPATGIYGIKDVVTDGSSTIYFWLPPVAINAPHVQLTGGNTYVNYYTRGTAENTKTLTAPTTISHNVLGDLHTFPNLPAGYAASDFAPHSVTVTNSGTNAATGLSVTLSGSNASSFTLGGTTSGSILATSGSNTVMFTVLPAVGLAVGAYSATVTVAADNAAPITFTVSVTVAANATVSPATTSFDLFAGPGYADITLALTNPGGFTLNKITCGSHDLIVGTDYTVSGLSYTLQTSWLSILARGAHVIRFEMATGTSPTCTLTVKTELDYGLIFDGSGGFWLDRDNNQSITAGVDVVYTPAIGTATWTLSTLTLALTGFVWETPAPVALTIVNGPLTLDLTGDNRFVSTCATGSSSSAGLISASALTVAGNGTLTAIGGATSTASSSSTGISGDLTVNGATVSASGGASTGGGVSYGVNNNSITLNAGTLNASAHTGSSTGYGIYTNSLAIYGGTAEVAGGSQAISASATITLPDAYCYWTASPPTLPGSLYYGALGIPSSGSAPSFVNASTFNYVKIQTTQVATVSNITISGTAEAPLASGQTATLTLYNATVTSAGLSAVDVFGWFAGIPSGLTVTANATPGATDITLTFGGTPASALAAPFAINIPAGALTGASSVISVQSNPNAKFALDAALQIIGPSGMTLVQGYAATSSGVFSVAGLPVPSVSKTVGNPAITWNGADMRLDIAEGLSAGAYPVTLQATNGINPAASFTFTLTVSPYPLYNITIASSNGGSITANVSASRSGDAVTLTVTPYTGYELSDISGVPAAVSSHIRPDGATVYTFTMPDHDVTAKATFQKTAAQLLWESVLPLIENAVFSLTQLEAPNADAARYRLANLINELLAGTGVTVSASDIVIFLFQPAIGGFADNPEGVAGSIQFRITPPNMTPSAYSEAVITASPVSNGEWRMANGEWGIKAYVNNGVLYISGLIAGETWQIYTLTGTLIYSGIATGNVETLRMTSLPNHGIYIIKSGFKTTKIMASNSSK